MVLEFGMEVAVGMVMEAFAEDLVGSICGSPGLGIYIEAQLLTGAGVEAAAQLARSSEQRSRMK
jgi:hypothetical protein